MTQLAGRPEATPTPPPTAEANRLSLPQSTALVMGSIIGVGIFSLPYAIASYGPISLVAMALATIGAVALALMFAVLSRRIPADGGPYAYSRAAFGNGFGFSQAWLYWITAWAGNAAIAVGWVFYVQQFLNKGGSTLGSIAIALVGLWIPAAINLTGVRNMGVFQLWSTVLKFVPLALMATVGLFFIKAGNFTPWNTSGDTNLSAIGGAMAICLFSYLGVETAAVAAGKVRDPERNVPKSTIYGTLGSAVVYLLSLVAVFGILPAAALASDSNQASYSAAANSIAGGTWLGYIVADRRDHLRHRRAQRLDDDLRRDAAGSRKGRPLPHALRLALAARRAGLRHHLLDRARLGGRGDQLPRHQRRHRVHHAGPDDRHHRRHPVRRLSARSAEVAGDQTIRRGTPRDFALDVGVALVALVMSLAFVWYSRNSGDELVRRLGTVPDGRRSRPPRHPGLPLPARLDDRARPRARLQVRNQTP